MRLAVSIALATVILALTCPAHAHHSATPLFHQDQTVEVKGVVTLWRFSNPHPLLRIEVADEAGQKVAWDISFGNAAATALGKRGWSILTFKPGETVIAKGHPSKVAGTHGLDGAVTRADGRAVP